MLTGMDLKVAVASREDIAALIGRMSRLDDVVASTALEHEEEDSGEIVELRESADDAPVIKLVNQIIAQAVEQGASDVHLSPEGHQLRVRFRVDGVLTDTTTVPRRMVAGVVSRVKIMSDLDIAERRLPQDGRVGLTIDGHARRPARRDAAQRARRVGGHAHPRQGQRRDRPRQARDGRGGAQALPPRRSRRPTAPCS